MVLWNYGCPRQAWGKMSGGGKENVKKDKQGNKEKRLAQVYSPEGVTERRGGSDGRTGNPLTRSEIPLGALQEAGGGSEIRR